MHKRIPPRILIISSLILLPLISCEEEPTQSPPPQEEVPPKSDLRQKPPCLNPYGGFPEYYIGKVASPRINVYNQPVTYGTVLGTMLLGEKMRVLSVDVSQSPNYWLKIQAGKLVGWVEETGVVVSIPKESFAFSRKLAVDLDRDGSGETFYVYADDFFDPTHQTELSPNVPESAHIYARVDEGEPIILATVDTHQGTYRFYDLWREDIDGDGWQEAVLIWGFNPTHYGQYRHETILLSAFTLMDNAPHPILSLPLRHQRMFTAGGYGYDILSEYRFITFRDETVCRVEVHIRKVSYFFSDTSAPKETYDRHFPLFTFKDLIILEESFTRTIDFWWVDEAGAYLPGLPSNNLLNYAYPQTELSASIFFEGFLQESEEREVSGTVIVSSLPPIGGKSLVLEEDTKITVHRTLFIENDEWHIISPAEGLYKDNLIWARLPSRHTP